MYRAIRRALDFCTAAALLVLLLPVLLVAAIAVASDGGPVFFAQDRLGIGAYRFRLFKLRSMIVSADHYLDNDGRPTRKRTTKVGDFIRSTSIDELPQLVNVLRGDMGLIGPRPILPHMLRHMSARERKRFSIRPGLTGLAQVKGRNQIKWSLRFRYDVFYVSRMSPFLDMYICFLTLQRVLGARDIVLDRNSDKVDDVTTRIDSVDLRS